MKRIILGLLALTTPACTTHDDVGSVSMAVTSTGTDGATYRLTPGTRLSVDSTSPNGVPNYDVGLDGDSTDVSFQVQTGSYDANIYHPNGYTTEWPLERTYGGITSTVTAELITPQPVALTVLSGQTTSLVLQFQVDGGGTVTFDHGSIDVTVVVGEHPASAFDVGASGTGDIAGSPLIDGPYAPPLSGFMPGAGATGLQIAVTGHTTGAWAEVGGSVDPDGLNLSVCAPFQLDTTSGSGNDGLIALIAEANHGTAPSFLYGSANLCVIDDGTNGYLRIRFSREGTAETPAFQSILGTAPTLFHVQVLGQLPTRAYNSQTGTFDVDALLGTRDLPLIIKLQLRDDTDLGVFWYSARANGTGTFSFTGVP